MKIRSSSTFKYSFCVPGSQVEDPVYFVVDRMMRRYCTANVLVIAVPCHRWDERKYALLADETTEEAVEFAA